MGAYNVEINSHKLIHPLILQLSGKKGFKPRAQESREWISNYGEVQNENDC